MNLKTTLSVLLPSFLFASVLEAAEPLRLPDIPGFKTLHCDFHMHTVFSDGKVWPDVRVHEALAEGLDCIALTDHLKYNKDQSRKKHPDVFGTLNRPWEIASEAASGSDLVVIRGAEVTQGMPPGHINAVFLTDADIARPDLRETLTIAQDQGAFMFWNHPSWKSPDKKWEQDAIAQWFDEHTELLQAGVLNGIEVVNGATYSREAHQWAIEKNLTMFGNSDIHTPIGIEYEFGHEHRAMTLVFAQEKSARGVREALFERRTAVWFEDYLIGNPEFLAPLFEACVEQESAAYLENLAIAVMHNRCPMDFHVENEGSYSFYNAPQFFSIKAGETRGLAIKTGTRLDKIDLSISVRNLVVKPDEALKTTLSFDVAGSIPDKKILDSLGSD